MLVQTEKNKYLYILAFVAVLGFLNKYNILFMLAGLAPAIIISPFRDIFRNKHLYFAIAFFLLLVSPNILWQVQNNHPVVHHMKTLARTQLVNFERLGFLKEQVLFFLNSLFILIAAANQLCPLSSFSYLPVYRTWGYLFSIALYVYMHAKGYYAIGLYPALLAFGAVYLEYGERRNARSGCSRPLMILVQILLFIPIFQVAMPNKSPEQIAANLETIPEVGNAEMGGWKRTSSSAGFCGYAGLA